MPSLARRTGDDGALTPRWAILDERRRDLAAAREALERESSVGLWDGVEPDNNAVRTDTRVHGELAVLPQLLQVGALEGLVVLRVRHGHLAHPRVHPWAQGRAPVLFARKQRREAILMARNGRWP